MSLKVYLKITSFIGISPEPTHYYGELSVSRSTDIPNRETYNLEYRLTSKHAATRNKIHSHFFPEDAIKHRYFVGQLTDRFDSREELIEYAEKHYQEYFPTGTELVIKNFN